jgi:hypothetical protein
MRVIDAMILALYAPIVMFSGAACWLYLVRVLVPAIRHGTFSLERHAVALSAIAALLAHFIESLFYGLGRYDFEYQYLWARLEWVGPMKVVILFSSVLAVAVYNKAAFGKMNLLRLNVIAFGAWLAFYVFLIETR